MRLLISGGGSGGHVFAGLAVAQAFRARHPTGAVLMVGRTGGMEEHAVPAAGFDLETIPVRGWDRDTFWPNLRLPDVLPRALGRGLRVLDRFRPDVVLGVGAYAMIPCGWAALRRGVPYVLQVSEPDGLAHRMLRGGAAAACMTFPDDVAVFPVRRAVVTGYPLRPGFTRRTPRVPPRRLLVIGGSLGARRLNLAVWEALDRLLGTFEEVIHLTGIQGAPEGARLAQPGYRAIAMQTDVGGLMRHADLVLSRAGCGTCAEVTAVGLPAVLVPGPFGGRHQEHNATRLTRAGAATRIADEDLTGDRLMEHLGELHFLQFSGAIGYPFLQGYPERMRRALGRRKRMIGMDRARRFVETVGADCFAPSSGPPCFLDPSLFWLNDLGEDDGNVFPDQWTFLDHMRRHGHGQGSLVVPGSVAEITSRGVRMTHPLSDERIREHFSVDGKRRYLDAYRERKRPVMERLEASLPRGRVEVVRELREWWEPLLAEADLVCAGVNGRMAIDFDDDPDGLVVDFHDRAVRPWSADPDDLVEHHFTFPRHLVEDCVLEHRENWSTDLLLSFRFRETSRRPFNKYLFAFLSALSHERIEYVERFYRAEAHRGEAGGQPFFRMSIGDREHLVQQRCPHASADLRRFLEYDEATDTLTCAVHGWQWRRTGECLTTDGHHLYVRPVDELEPGEAPGSAELSGATVRRHCADCTYRLRSADRLVPA